MTTSAPERIVPKRGMMHQPPSARVMLAKIAMLAVVDAIAVFAMSILFFQEHWVVLAILGGVTLLVNIVYLSPGLLPAKYLTPGLIFLAVFQVFVIVYTLIFAAGTTYMLRMMARPPHDHERGPVRGQPQHAAGIMPGGAAAATSGPELR